LRPLLRHTTVRHVCYGHTPLCALFFGHTPLCALRHHSYTATQLHSYTATRLHGYTATQLHSYTATRLRPRLCAPRLLRPHATVRHLRLGHTPLCASATSRPHTTVRPLQRLGHTTVCALCNVSATQRVRPLQRLGHTTVCALCSSPATSYCAPSSPATRYCAPSPSATPAVRHHLREPHAATFGHHDTVTSAVSTTSVATRLDLHRGGDKTAATLFNLAFTSWRVANMQTLTCPKRPSIFASRTQLAFASSLEEERLQDQSRNHRRQPRQEERVTPTPFGASTRAHQRHSSHLSALLLAPASDTARAFRRFCSRPPATRLAPFGASARARQRHSLAFRPSTRACPTRRRRSTPQEEHLPTRTAIDIVATLATRTTRQAAWRI
jgi:hypothetical protein